MNDKLNPLLFPMKSSVSPNQANLELITSFQWVGDSWIGNEIENPIIPESDGTVICRYENPTVIVIDLAWGRYREPGSIRATYLFDKLKDTTN